MYKYPAVKGSELQPKRIFFEKTLFFLFLNFRSFPLDIPGVLY